MEENGCRLNGLAFPRWLSIPDFALIAR